MIILGITGTNGAGKGAVVEYLKKKGFEHYSARALIAREIAKRGLEANRDNFIIVANDLRANHSPAYIIEELYKHAYQVGQDCVIESFRTVGEVEGMRTKPNFYMLAVDAEIKTRYERIVKRASETDHITFAQFIAQEQKELSSTDPNKQNIAECFKRANYVLHNDGNFADLNSQIEKVLQEIQEKA